ncbi:MAG: ABC transporter substrate-binding protein [Gammaproteobacteria bacterium]|nr:ABC transporter substrate-binding protein [Gammaproteobacteria bacterium]
MKQILKTAQAAALAVCVAAAAAAAPAQAAAKTLKIGFLGVMSGPSASWGLVNRYCIEVAAKEINRRGGWQIGGDKYMIEVVSIDDRKDPKISVTSAERLVYEEGVKYIIGPNTAATAAAIVPVINKAGAVNIAYALSKELYSLPNGNSILGMIAPYQSGPVIYRHLRDNNGVKTVSFVASNEPDPLTQRDDGLAAARDLGLRVLDADATYEAGTTDFFPVMSRVVAKRPDLIVLSGAAPANAPLLIKAARQQGYKGLLSTETAQDAGVLKEGAGALANGFISVGGASNEQIRSREMEEFIERYKEHVGEWNDEAGTKVYALEMILQTLAAAGPQAIDDVEVFKRAIPELRYKNPFLKETQDLTFVGSSFFGQKRQIGVPMVVNVYQDGGFETLFVGSVPE